MSIEPGAGGDATLGADHGFAAASVPIEMRPFCDKQRTEAQAWVSAESKDEGGHRG
jgi:hypothetical protein